MNKVELFENGRATGYNQFVETWILNYHYFLNLLPKAKGFAGRGIGNEIERVVQAPKQCTITGIYSSPEMIKQASEKFQTYHNVSLMEGFTIRPWH